MQKLNKFRALILESPSGKGESWLKAQEQRLKTYKTLETSRDIKERYAKEAQLKKIYSKKHGDAAFFLAELKKMKYTNKAFRNFMESCMHCGICMDKCHMWMSTGDINNTPVGRAELIRKIYKKLDKIAPEQIDMDKIYTYYYQCTECRRCSVFCPNGIDQSENTRTIREILTNMGLQPEYVVATIAEMYRVGNNLGLNEKAIGAVTAFIEEELKEETGRDISVPIDKRKADILLVPSSADLYVNTDTLKGYAKFLYKMNKDYTISTKITEAANFGLFSSERHLRDIGNMALQEALNRGVKLVVWGECGHGWRSASNFLRYELAKHGIPLIHIHQMVAKALARKQITVDKNKNDDLYNYHDPCNYARGGNLVHEPRTVLNSVVRETVEAKYTKAETLCCGAGAGLLADEKGWNELRAWTGWPAVYYSWKTEAHYMVSPCAIDKAQFPYVVRYHKVPMEIKGLMDLVGYAIEL